MFTHVYCGSVMLDKSSLSWEPASFFGFFHCWLQAVARDLGRGVSDLTGCDIFSGLVARRGLRRLVRLAEPWGP